MKAVTQRIIVITMLALSGLACSAASAGATLASRYTGTAHNTSYDITSALELVDVVENEAGDVSGQLVVQPPLYGSGPFTGTISAGQISFTVTPDPATAAETSATFIGEVQADGQLSGTYTTQGEGTQSGTWTVGTGGSTPVLATTMTLAAISGEVTFRLPGASSFSRLVGSISVPDKTEVDTISGRATVTVAAGSGAASETALLYGGAFVIEQESGAPYETHFVLSQPLTCASGAARGHAASELPHVPTAPPPAKRRHLWVHDTGGSFGTIGRYVSTTVEGTRWLTIDTCAVSTVRVAEGKVAVENLKTKRTVVVRAGSHVSTGGGRSAAPAGPLAAVDAYWAAIRRHDFAQAYDDLVRGTAGSRPAFVSGEREQGVESVEFRGRLAGSSSSKARVDVVSLVTRDHKFGCRTWSGSYDLVAQGGGWLIQRAVLSVKPCGG